MEFLGRGGGVRAVHDFRRMGQLRDDLAKNGKYNCVGLNYTSYHLFQSLRMQMCPLWWRLDKSGSLDRSLLTDRLVISLSTAHLLSIVVASSLLFFLPDKEHVF